MFRMWLDRANASAQYVGDGVIRVLVLAAVVFLLIGAFYAVLAITRLVRRSAWPGDSPQYRNHLGMARWIERQLRDDMVQVTIPEPEKHEARRLLERFYGERHIAPGTPEE
jgi:hypothetical protein